MFLDFCLTFIRYLIILAVLTPIVLVVGALLVLTFPWGLIILLLCSSQRGAVHEAK